MAYKRISLAKLLAGATGHVIGSRGLEFGTTGLHQPFDVITAMTVSLSQYIICLPNETLQNRTCFLSAIPKDYKVLKILH